ncbi:MAG: c-type cytochrome [Nitrospina sp.]|nr:c-type cytochrome [Nitrospina sp.]
MGLAFALGLSPAWGFTPPAAEDVPESITVRGKTHTLKDLTNPLWAQPEKIPEFVRQGSDLYFKHCVFCHGDLLNGEGLLADRFTPRPANFHTKDSIFDRPESYAFWRIMKGGPGLPQKSEPWNSVMPAWEDVLSEQDVWKIIVFIFDGVANPLTPDTPQEASLERGRVVYEDKCAICHGPEGAGDGVSAEQMSPRPRNLTKGQYKIRSTPFGKIPTDDDLHAMLVHGYPETTMPSWRHLPEVDLQSLILLLKEFGKKKFERAVKKNKMPEPVVVPEPPQFTLESVERGRKLFLQNCSGCHGVKGRGDGESTKKIVDIATDAIRPRNLSQPWTFRRGSRREDLFMTLRTGLSTTAMPRFSDRIHPDQNIWDLVHYVQTLSLLLKPQVHKNLKMTRVEGALPQGPEDPRWQQITSFFVPLGSQIMQGEKSYFTTVNNLWVEAVHNGKEIALRIRWDDPTYDPILESVTKVVESPAPPLPPHLRVEEDEEEEHLAAASPEAAQFPDALAVQLAGPESALDNLPYLLNGDESNPVTLWKWQSNPNGARQFTARGMGNTSPIENTSPLNSEVIFEYGQYSLVLKKKLDQTDPAHPDRLLPGSIIPIAFNAWDGGMKETGTRRSVSNWFYLIAD